MAVTAPRTGYAPVNGLEMYYEIHRPATERSLVLLHGAFSATGTSWTSRGCSTKVMEPNRNLSDWPAEAVSSIKAPILIVIGDSDIVRPEHAVEIVRLRGGGVVGDWVGIPTSHLTILPGTAHSTIMQRPDLPLPMIGTFLDVPMPAA